MNISHIYHRGNDLTMKSKKYQSESNNAGDFYDGV